MTHRDGSRASTAFLTFASSILLVGASCGATADDAASAPATKYVVPAPFALQFVGPYACDDAEAGAVRWLELHRDGSYAASVGGSEEVAHGAYKASARHELPLVFETFDALRPLAVDWTLTVDAYDSRATARRAGERSAMRAVLPVGPLEGLCQASGGAWLDDDVDPATGLYCRCPPLEVYLPSSGGCVR